ncbi:MAG: hypothetical protein VX938_03235, partial [Myxococcota bacterium]|nr:hypothetical protein [Myxococcota bacterium]
MKFVGRLGLLVSLLGMSAVAQAAVLPTQGVVRDNANVVVHQAVFGATFRLYDSPDAEEALWTEFWPPAGQTCAASPQSCLQVSRGVFQVNLGSHTPLTSEIFSSGGLWLGLSVESEPELPRRPLGTTGYAFHADTALWASDAATLGGLTPEDFEPVGAAADAISQHLAETPHLTTDEHAALTG